MLLAALDFDGYVSSSEDRHERPPSRLWVGSELETIRRVLVIKSFYYGQNKQLAVGCLPDQTVQLSHLHHLLPLEVL